MQDGASSSVPLRLPEDFEVAVPREGGGALSTGGPWRVEILYRGPIEAPVAQGQEIARLRFTMDGKTVMEAPLEADVAVPKANAAQRVFNAVGRWTR